MRIAADQVRLVALLTERLGSEAAAVHLDAAVPWPELPTVADLLRHVGVVHRWTTAILRSGARVAEETVDVPDGGILDWYAEGRRALLAELAGADDRPCWTIGDRAGTAAFWVRRMVLENAKHLMDVRAAGGAGWRILPELGAGDFADGIDELFAVFLRRSRPTLIALPGTVELIATDADRTWRIGPDWAVGGTGAPAASVTASAGDLAAALWERADPLNDQDRFAITGDRPAAAALLAAPIHPW